MTAVKEINAAGVKYLNIAKLCHVPRNKITRWAVGESAPSKDSIAMKALISLWTEVRRNHRSYSDVASRNVTRLINAGVTRREISQYLGSGSGTSVSSITEYRNGSKMWPFLLAKKMKKIDVDSILSGQQSLLESLPSPRISPSRVKPRGANLATRMNSIVRMLEFLEGENVTYDYIAASCEATKKTVLRWRRGIHVPKGVQLDNLKTLHAWVRDHTYDQTYEKARVRVIDLYGSGVGYDEISFRTEISVSKIKRLVEEKEVEISYEVLRGILHALPRTELNPKPSRPVVVEPEEEQPRPEPEPEPNESSQVRPVDERIDDLTLLFIDGLIDRSRFLRVREKIESAGK